MSGPGPVREGARWRHAKPTGDEVAAWFKDVPLDDGMEHDKYVSGLVLIPAKEKVKRPHPNGNGVVEAEELTFTPYVRVDTRIAYFRALAAKDELIAVIEPVKVPRVEDNAHMPDGFWWLSVPSGNNAVQRFVCCTMRVALYEREAWLASAPKSVEHDGHTTTTVAPAVPVREGVATKQVPLISWNKPDPNALAKAETGAIGRALGMAGILVLGTGIATAEDMADLRDAPAAEEPSLPAAQGESEDVLNARLIGLEAALRAANPEEHRQFIAWWQERSQEAGWAQLKDAPVEVRRGMARRLEQHHEKAKMQAPAESHPEIDAPPTDSSQSEDVHGPTAGHTIEGSLEPKGGAV